MTSVSPHDAVRSQSRCYYSRGEVHTSDKWAGESAIDELYMVSIMFRACTNGAYHSKSITVSIRI